jgi:hypothetical protein
MLAKWEISLLLHQHNGIHPRADGMVVDLKSRFNIDRPLARRALYDEHLYQRDGVHVVDAGSVVQ